MIESEFRQIIENKQICYFISPHFDDAVLSAGSLMLFLSKFTRVHVINVFTDSGYKPYTMSAVANFRICGAKSPKSLYEARNIEDTSALSLINVQKTNLGYTDALYRKKVSKNVLSKFLPEIIHIYPTYRYHILKGSISEHDKELKKSLFRFLNELPRDAVIFAPSAIGNHVDHMLVKEVSELLPHKVIHWYDFPYPKNKNSLQGYKKIIKFDRYKKQKLNALKQYKTQFNSLFPEGISLPAEEYYFK